MSSDSSKLIVLTLAGIIGILFLVLFEYRNVPDYSLKQNYNYKSKDPYGAWVFEQLVKSRFPDAPIYYNQLDTLVNEIYGSNNLYIKFGKSIKLNSTEKYEMQEWIARGNKAIYICPFLRIDELKSNSSFASFYLRDSVLSFTHEIGSEIKHFAYDSLFAVFEAPTDLTHYTAKTYYTDSLQGKTSFMEHPISIEQLIGDGSLVHHSMPILFANLAKDCEGYLPHFQAIINQPDVNSVILDHQMFDKVHSRHRKGKYTKNSTGEYIRSDGPSYINNRVNESKLQYILNNRSLKWAYYLMLVFMLIYIWFNSKRKQAIIPVLEKKENTTIEYVETIASMYEKQGQHTKLILKMKDIFYQRVKEKYFLDQNDPQFISKLVKKSKVDKEQIDRIFRDFGFAERGDTFTQMQLAGTYERIEKFYKKMA